MPATQTPRKMTPRELDALRKRILADQAAERKRAEAESWRQLTNDIKSGINDILGRGVIAPALGAPADVGDLLWNAGAWINNRIKDFEAATGLVDKPRYVQYSQGNPYLGSEDIGNRMQQAGLVSPTRRPITELSASLVSPGAAVKTVVNAPRTAMNMLRVADRIEAPVRTLADTVLVPSGSGYVGRTPQIGAIENLYHGSPHTFDRFDLSKIGTGEGAQAYGHGAYLAESPEVAGEYQKRLSKDFLVDGAPIDADQSMRVMLDDIANGGRAEDWIRLTAKDMNEPDLVRASELAKTLVGKKVIEQSGVGGTLYQTRLAWPDPAREAATPLKPEDFLDWDKPLSEQPVKDKVIKAFKDRGFADWQIESMLNRGITGEQANVYLGGISGSEAASKSMLESGIPGIRYLDAGSRAAGEGSRNYVVFDDKLIDIVARNNQPIKKAEVPQADYRISHRPMTVEGGSSTLDDLTKSFGNDIYTDEALQIFGSGDKREADVLKQLRMLRGNPNKEVTIYRGVPGNVEKINYGDWVTLSKGTAQDYANTFPDGKVISQRVPASHVTAWADSLLEQGYYPPKQN